MADWTARKLTREDSWLYQQLVTEFYHSDGVDHPIPADYIARTFDQLMRGEDYLVCYVLEQAGQTAGYALLAKMFSQEAGGIAIWLEELYLRPDFRGQGIGDGFLEWVKAQWQGQAVRWRLEVVGTHDRVKALYARHGFEPMPYDQMVLDIPN